MKLLCEGCSEPVMFTVLFTVPVQPTVVPGEEGSEGLIEHSGTLVVANILI